MTMSQQLLVHICGSANDQAHYFKREICFLRDNFSWFATHECSSLGWLGQDAAGFEIPLVRAQSGNINNGLGIDEMHLSLSQFPPSIGKLARRNPNVPALRTFSSIAVF